MQAELVDGFLAWDFDADTAATFFAQQVYHTGSRKSVIRKTMLCFFRPYLRRHSLTNILSYFFAEQGTRIQQLVAAR